MQVDRHSGESRLGFVFGIGVILVLAGAYFGWLTFKEAMAVMHEPEVVGRWLDLQDQIFADAKDSFKTSESKIVSGHVLIGFAVVYLFILSRITVVFLKYGIQLIFKGIDTAKNKTA